MPPKPVSYKGKEYSSRKELCQEYGIDEKRVTGRLCSGWTLEEAVEAVAGGEFEAGTMLPKIEAAIAYLSKVRAGKVLITSMAKVKEAVRGRAGTVITV